MLKLSRLNVQYVISLHYQERENPQELKRVKRTNVQVSESGMKSVKYCKVVRQGKVDLVDSMRVLHDCLDQGSCVKLDTRLKLGKGAYRHAKCTPRYEMIRDI